MLRTRIPLLKFYINVSPPSNEMRKIPIAISVIVYFCLHGTVNRTTIVLMSGRVATDLRSSGPESVAIQPINLSLLRELRNT